MEVSPVGFLILLVYASVVLFVLYVLWSILGALRSIDRTMTDIARHLRNQP